MQVSSYDKLFHLRKDRQGRLIPLVATLDDNGKFHAWLPKGDDIIDIKVIDLVEGQYFAKKAGANDDIYFGFLNFLYQRNTVKSLFPFVEYITSDMRNLATSLRKLEIFHEIHHKEDSGRLVISELEYIITVCRSMYDHFQFIAKKIWDGIKLIDPATQKNSLSDSFSAMVLQGERLRTPNEISMKYSLTPQLSKFYSDGGIFFEKLRSFRDDIVHYGHTPGYIYVTEKGFSVNANHKLFSSFNIWTPGCYYPNDKLASLKPVIAYIIRETLGTMGRFVNVLEQQIKFPDDIAPGYLLFMRGRYLYKLAELDSYINNNVWYSDISEKTESRANIG
jgi:hypothetical protein